MDVQTLRSESKTLNTVRFKILQIVIFIFLKYLVECLFKEELKNNKNR